MKFKDLLKWYHISALISWLSLGIFFINMSMTDNSAGIYDYKGFIPQPWEVMFPFIWLIFSLVGLGGWSEASIERYKLKR